MSPTRTIPCSNTLKRSPGFLCSCVVRRWSHRHSDIHHAFFGSNIFYDWGIWKLVFMGSCLFKIGLGHIVCIFTGAQSGVYHGK